MQQYMAQEPTITNVQYITQRVEQIAARQEEMALKIAARQEEMGLKVERLPTRDELATQLGSKVDVASYTIAQRALEEAVRQHTQLITTVQQAIQVQATTRQDEMHKAMGSTQLLQEKVADVQRDVAHLENAPQKFRTSATFYVMITGIAISTACSGTGLLVSALALLMHFFGH